MKICLLGNMNNSHYVLAKLLRRNGINAYLILFETDKLYLPEQEDSFLLNGYPDWIKRVRWGSVGSLLFTSSKKLRLDLTGFDLYVICGQGPLFLKKARIDKYIFLPYGCDLYLLTSKKALTRAVKEIYGFFACLLSYLPIIFFSEMQKKAIQEAIAVSIILEAPYYKEIQRLKLNSKTISLGIPLDLVKFKADNLNNEIIHNTQNEKIKTLIHKRKEYEILVFAPARHEWRKDLPDPNNNKGNDILIKGVSKAIKEKGIRILLVLVEWGRDFLLSKKLIKELSIEENVVWIPRVPREELRYYYYLSDIVADQFCAGGHGVLALEVLALEKVLLTYINNDFEITAKRPVPPCLNAKTPEQICAMLADFATNRKAYANMGKRGRQWVENYHGDGLVEEYIRLFKHILNGKDIREFIPSFEKEIES